jgi:hypothetical protein
MDKQERLLAGTEGSARLAAPDRLQPRGDGFVIEASQHSAIADHVDVLDQDLTAGKVRDLQLVDEMSLPVGAREWHRRVLHGHKQWRDRFRATRRFGEGQQT